MVLSQTRSLLSLRPSWPLFTGCGMHKLFFSLLWQRIFDGKCLCSPFFAVKFMWFVPIAARGWMGEKQGNSYHHLFCLQGVISHSMSWTLSIHPIWFTWWDSCKADVAVQQHSQTFLQQAVKKPDFQSDGPRKFSSSEPSQLLLHVAACICQLMQESTLHVMGSLCRFSSSFYLSVKAQSYHRHLNWITIVSAFYRITCKAQRCGTH